MDYFKSAVLPFFADLTAKTHGKRLIRSRNKPCRAVLHPCVGSFNLVSVDYLLAEKPVFIAYRKARCGIISRRQRVHKASRKPAETAVSEARIRLHLIDFVKVEAHIAQSASVLLFKSHIEEVVFQRSADEKFHAHIVDALLLLSLYGVFERCPLLRQSVADAHYDGFVNLCFGCVLCHRAEMAGELLGEQRFYVCFCSCVTFSHVFFPFAFIDLLRFRKVRHTSLPKRSTKNLFSLFCGRAFSKPLCPYRAPLPDKLRFPYRLHYMPQT